MRFFPQLTLFLVILAFFSSCKDDDFDKDPILRLPIKTLSFEKGADIKSLEFGINDGDELLYTIVSSAGTEWIHATITTDNIEVAVAENFADGSREATIKLRLRKGNLSETITVTQNDGSYIKASEETISYLFQGGEQTLYIESSSSTWGFSVTGAEDWLTIDPAEASKNKLLLTATENTEIHPRVATIILTNEKQEKCAVTVTQNGLTHFEFPFIEEMGYVYYGDISERGLRYPLSLAHAYDFEYARGNSFLRVQGKYIHMFKSRSSVFSQTNYSVYQFQEFRREAVRFAFALDTDGTRALTIQNDQEFLAYVKKQGFEFAWKTTPDSTTTYWNEELQVAMQIMHPTNTRAQKGLSFVHTKTRPNSPNNQVDDFPTFDKLPIGYTVWGVPAQKVIDWEKENGGTMLVEEGDSSTIVFEADMTKTPGVIERVYTFDDEGLLATTMFMMDDIEKGLYQTGIANEDYAYIPTKEFTDLLTSNGYEYERKGSFPPQFHYKNTAKNMWCKVHVERYDLEGIIPRLCLTLNAIP